MRAGQPAYWVSCLSPLARSLMRIITSFFLFLILAVSFGIWKISLSTHTLNSQITKVEEDIRRIGQESKGLLKYKEEQDLSLDKFYLEVFNDINEICSYYNADCEVKINEAKDFVNTQEFFRESQYKGIRHLDIFCRVDLKGQLDTYLFDMLYKMVKSKPIEILEVNLEKNILNLTMRLYGL